MPDIQTINLLQRITGLTAFGLLFIQIVLGSNMDFWRTKLGDKALKLHIVNGILTYTFIFLHPILMVLYMYSYSSNFDPFYVYTDFCVLCDGAYEYYINFGRLAFLFTTIAVFAGLFRGMNMWMRQNWRKLHILNYFAFYFVSIHSYNIGSDSSEPLFTYLFWTAQIVVLVSVIKKLKEVFKPKLEV
jgi:predicted ferric reductase